MSLRVRVLGSAAGGGLPQWNCGCPHCRGIRDGSLDIPPRTQSSLAVSGDGGESWFLLNASPEVRTQIERFAGLHPRGLRHSPIAGIALANGDLDHCLGLLSLRESHPLRIYAPAAVRRGFVEGNVLYRTLERFPGQVTWYDLAIDRPQRLLESNGRPGPLTLEAVAAPGKLPVHLQGRATPEPAINVALKVRDERSGRSVLYAPAVEHLTPALTRALAEVKAVFFDGTFWSSDELVALGAGERRAEEMGHWPVGGPGGSLEMLAGLSARRVLIHINNTNPLLRKGSAEHRAVLAAGVELAEDGMEALL